MHNIGLTVLSRSFRPDAIMALYLDPSRKDKNSTNLPCPKSDVDAAACLPKSLGNRSIRCYPLQFGSRHGPLNLAPRRLFPCSGGVRT